MFLIMCYQYQYVLINIMKINVIKLRSFMDYAYKLFISHGFAAKDCLWLATGHRQTTYNYDC